MTEPAKAITPDVDADKLPIDAHEDYRRARRNSLWWSAISLLAVIALPKSPFDPFRLGPADLDLPAWIVLASLISASTFMLAGYIRAQRYLVFRHSQRMLRPEARDTEDSSRDALATIDDLKASVQAVGQKLNEASSRAATFDVRVRALQEREDEEVAECAPWSMPEWPECPNTSID